MKKRTYKVINQLKQSGYNVSIKHLRATFSETLNKIVYTEKEVCIDDTTRRFNDNLSKGGKTIVELTKDGFSSQAEATCSMGDNYNKEEGRRIALSRVIREAIPNKSERIKIWE